MSKSKTERKKQKRKVKKKKVRAAKAQRMYRDNGWFYFNEAGFYFETGNLDYAVQAIKKAAKILPDEEKIFQLMGEIGSGSKNLDLEFYALSRLEKMGELDDEMRIRIISLLYSAQKYDECIKKADNLLENFTRVKIKNKRKVKKTLEAMREYCTVVLRAKEKKAIFEKNSQYSRSISSDNQSNTPVKQKKSARKNYGKAGPVSKGNSKQDTPQNSKQETPPESKAGSNIQKKLKKKTESARAEITADVPITYTIDVEPFVKAFSDPVPADPETYELALMSHEIRFTESFETLICLSELKSVKSFWYQEETAKKVLKQFRGRALLSDEVGLGKTIEALIVLTEYIKRNMVKTCLILTPTPLVSQWKEEIKSKFNMDVPSTDDPGYKSGSKKFWKKPFVIASINYAKSKKNFDYITAQKYDMIIVDEAHHLKNRTTLNWKLVNSLKKRFILLLTATPVENNLMELYNLITLLKPGQLETATSFREKFMKKGDPTDPKNQALLKELLSQVMIRNTRAVAADINIPPRFAQTIRIEPTKAEQAFYERLEALIMSLTEKNQAKSRILVINLLAQAGSSPKAVESTLNKMLEKQSYLLEHEEEIRAVKNLCRTTLDTPKNLALLKLVRSEKEKIIVFVKFKATVDYLAEFLEWNNISFSLFHGGMTNRQKDQAIDSFKNQTQVLITTEIGGEGRNLQFCSRMVNYDLPWNPMKIEQRIGRIHRIGQEKEVQIFNFCAAGSIEDYILDILDRKINMFEMVIGEIDMILGRIRGEKEFSDMVYEIWVNSKTKQERQKGFANLGAKLKRAKTGYNKSSMLDDKLFGDSYEL